MRFSHQVTHVCAALATLFTLSLAALAQGTFGTPTNIGVSDQKAGAVLVFPYYTSDANASSTSGKNTVLTLTNVCNGPSTVGGVRNNAYLHLFFIDGSCAPVDTYVCLTPNAGLQILASDYDPGTAGYIIAVAVESDGSPTDDETSANCFIGSALFRDGSGSFGSYGAEAFRKVLPTSVPVDPDGTATITLNGTLYDAAPTQFAAQVTTPLASTNTLAQEIVLASVSGDLAGAGMNTINFTSVGVVYRSDEATASFVPNFGSGTCFKTADAKDAFRVVGSGVGNTSINNRLYAFLAGVPSGFQAGYGYAKFNTTPAVGLMRIREATVGAVIWTGIRNLHKTATGTALIRIPVFSPFCQFT